MTDGSRRRSAVNVMRFALRMTGVPTPWRAVTSFPSHPARRPNALDRKAPSLVDLINRSHDSSGNSRCGSSSQKSGVLKLSKTFAFAEAWRKCRALGARAKHRLAKLRRLRRRSDALSSARSSLSSARWQLRAAPLPKPASGVWLRTNAASRDRAPKAGPLSAGACDHKKPFIQVCFDKARQVWPLCRACRQKLPFAPFAFLASQCSRLRRRSAVPAAIRTQQTSAERAARGHRR